MEESMTTDIVKHEHMKKAGALNNAAIFRQLFKPESVEFSAAAKERLTQDEEIAKLMGLLEQQTAEKEGRDRCMGATVALLKYAHKMIERAEGTIKAQEDRIKDLEKIATHDELTGIKNRRGFYESFTRELDKCERGISQGGLLVLIDLDNFKTINDVHGHMAGDACLRLVARTLENEIRAMDVVARLGGDEFVILLSNTSKEGAAGRAQNLAWQLNHLSMAWYGEELPIRASLGLRSYGKGDRADRIFNDADIALYANKRSRSRKRKDGTMRA